MSANLVLRPTFYILNPLVFWLETVLAAVLVLLMIVSMIRKKNSAVWWEVMLAVLALAGVWIFCLAVFPLWAAVVIASVVTVLGYLWLITFAVNVFYVAGSLGIGLMAAWHFPLYVMLAVSLGVLLYEHLREKQAGLALLYFEARRSSFVPGFLLPVDIRGWFRGRLKTWQAGEGQIVSILPIMALAGLSFRLLMEFDVLYFWFFSIFVMLVGLVFGLDVKKHLRTKLFLAMAILGALIIFLLNL